MNDLEGSVLPSDECALAQAKRDQKSALQHAKLIDIFAPYSSIKKTDLNKENISHFILQYDVKYDKHQYRNEYKFNCYKMKLASDYVKANIKLELNDDELLQSIQSLKLMFRGGAPNVPGLFEIAVYGIISNPDFSWKIFENEKWCEHKWELPRRERIDKNCEEVTDMKPGILYYPVDPQFPGCVCKVCAKEVI